MSQGIELTKHNEFSRIAVSLADHIGAYAHVHACVTFRVWEISLPPRIWRKKNHTYHYIIVQPDLILKYEFSVFSSVKVHSVMYSSLKSFPANTNVLRIDS